MDVRAEVVAAADRIQGRIRETPVEFSHVLSGEGRCRVHLKLENQQVTGSFKIRGAMNKVLSLTPVEQQRGVVAASSGNHGAAVACAAWSVGCSAVIFVPEGASPSKIAAIRSYGVDVRTCGDDCVVSERAARAYAEVEDYIYISPYNDLKVVAGQGTIGLELERQVEGLDAILVSMGGGGLVSGIGGCLKWSRERIEVIAASPENSPVMHASLEAGRILDMKSAPTLSDGTAGGVEANAITFGLCQEFVDDSVLVSEEEIRQAMRLIVDKHHMLLEGAAGVAVAAFLKHKDRFVGRNVVVVLCGANIDLAVLKSLL